MMSHAFFLIQIIIFPGIYFSSDPVVCVNFLKPGKGKKYRHMQSDTLYKSYHYNVIVFTLGLLSVYAPALK